MDIDPETVKEIRAILGRDCIVEVTVTFYDNSDSDALEPIDIGADMNLEADSSPAERQQYFGEMLDSLRGVFQSMTDAP